MSFAIQSIVMKPDGGSTEKKVELLRQEIIPNLPKIAAPATLNVLFNHHLDLLAGLIKPTDFYRLLRDWVESRTPAASGRF